MWEVLWKCALTGLVVGGLVGYAERSGVKDAILVGDSIDDLLVGLTSKTGSKNRPAQ